MEVKLEFLGTGTSQGVPVIACPCEVCASQCTRDRRLRTSALLQVGAKNIVIDSGPDFRQQMLRADVKTLDAILFTHGHKDHTGGMDDVRAFNYVSKRPLDVYAEARVQATLRMEYAYVFAETRYPGVPEIQLHTIDEQAFEVSGIPVIPVRAMHLNLPVLGFRIGALAYMTDVNRITDSEKDKLRGLDCLVINGLRQKPHLSHFSLPEALALIDDVKPREAYITHISHQMGFHDAIQATLPQGVWLAYDGLRISARFV